MVAYVVEHGEKQFGWRLESNHGCFAICTRSFRTKKGAEGSLAAYAVSEKTGEVYMDKQGKFRFRVRGANRKILCKGPDAFAHRRHCRQVCDVAVAYGAE